MSDVLAINHEARAESRLATQYRESEKLIGYLKAIISESNNLELAMLETLTNRTIDLAGGVVLDVIGSIVGQQRYVKLNPNAPAFGFDGAYNALPFGDLNDPEVGGEFVSLDGDFGEVLSDIDYRTFIKARILRNHSKGTVNDIISSVLFISGCDSVILQEFIAKIKLEMVGIVDDGVANILQNIDILAKPAGVGIEWEPYYNLDSFVFALRVESQDVSRHEISLSGDVQLDGNGSIVFDGTGDVATLADSDDWTFETDDFTVQMHVYLEDLIDAHIVNHYEGGNDRWTIDFEPAGLTRFYFYDGGVQYSVDANLATWGIQTWYHLAVTRKDGVFYFFQNGNIVGTAVHPQAIGNYAGSLYIGQRGDGSARFTGKLSRIVIDNGLARWDDTFTPPERISGVEVFDTTVFYPNLNGSAGSTDIYDNAQPAYSGDPIPIDYIGSPNGYVEQPTPANRPYYDPEAGTILFNGVDQWLYNDSLPALEQPFTVYAKCKISTAVLAQTIFGDVNAFVGLTADEYLEGNAGVSISDATDHSGEFKTFAVEFDGADSVLFVDGVQVATGNLGISAMNAFGWGAKANGADPIAMEAKGIYVRNYAYEEKINNLVTMI